MSMSPLDTWCMVRVRAVGDGVVEAKGRVEEARAEGRVAKKAAKTVVD